MSTANKLTYLNTTKQNIKSAINNAGANITNDTFRSYATTLGNRITKMRTDYETALSYLPMDTKTNTSVSITDAVDLPTYSFKLTKESTQSGTPTPESPIDVNVVEGYRNLFDISTITTKKYISKTNGTAQTSNNWSVSDYIPVDENTTYIYSGITNSSSSVAGTSFYDTNKTFISSIGSTTYSFTTPTNAKYLRLSLNSEEPTQVILNKGNTALPYVPYENNWIYTTITDGTNTKYVTLPLNGNVIAGIGDYKDEYIVDKYGHCYLNKKIGKVVLDGSESWTLHSSSTGTLYRYILTGTSFASTFTNLAIGTDSVLKNLILSNYFTPIVWANTTYGSISLYNTVGTYWCLLNFDNSDVSTLSLFNTWLSNNNTEVYYVLDTPQLIDLNYFVDMTLYEGTNTITNSETAPMEIIYVEDINTILATLTTPSVSE